MKTMTFIIGITKIKGNSLVYSSRESKAAKNWQPFLNPKVTRVTRGEIRLEHQRLYLGVWKPDLTVPKGWEGHV